MFPSRSGRHLSDGTLSKLCKENNVGCTPHGMRSSFRNWCAKTEVPTHVADLVLEHTPTSVDAISVPTWGTTNRHAFRDVHPQKSRNRPCPFPHARSKTSSHGSMGCVPDQNHSTQLTM